MTEASDEELLEKVRRGDPGGASELFARYSRPLYRFTARMTRSDAEAEEVTQEVFLKMIERVEQYDGRARVASWLFAIAANACRDRFRQSRRGVVVPLEAVAERPDTEESVDERLLASERRTLVRRALGSLSEEQRAALVLARYHGLPYAEIARVLSISEGAVKTRIFRAMETLKRVFAEGETPCRAVSS